MITTMTRPTARAAHAALSVLCERAIKGRLAWLQDGPAFIAVVGGTWADWFPGLQVSYGVKHALWHPRQAFATQALVIAACRALYDFGRHDSTDSRHFSA